MADNVWINEIHYDNAGADTGEFIEIAGAAGTDLTGYKVLLYNGATTGGTALKLYSTKDLSGSISDQSNGFGTVTITYPTDGIQNGSPDGVALVDSHGTVVQFLSYEGVMTAASGDNGAAAGMTSVDIGVSEAGATPFGKSLQLGGVGNKSSDFHWQSEADQTPGAVNTGQTFTGAGSNPTVSISNAQIAEGDSGTTVMTFTVTRSDASTAFKIDYATANGTATTADNDYVAASGSLTFAAGGALTQQVSVTVNGDTKTEANETFTVNLSNLVNTTGSTVIQTALGTGTINNDDVSLTAIHDIQGAGHASPLAGQTVTTQGIVTGLESNGFYIQAPDAAADANAQTSEGVFVFTSSAPPATAVIGALVNVTAKVQEFTASGSDPGSLSVTELSSVTDVTQLSTGHDLPTAVAVAPPTADLVAGNAYWESLEGMRVTVPSPLVTGPTNNFGEIWTVADNGANATGVNARGDILVSGGASDFGHVDTVGGDFNPERIQIEPGLGQQTPDVNAGAKLNDVTGIVNYSFGNYEVVATAPVTIASASPLTKAPTSLATGDANHLLIASYNAENLDPGDGAARFATVGGEIVNKLKTPDIVALQEIQDNNGETSSGVTSASTTLQMIVDAINAAGGPQYGYVDNPYIGNNTNGGAPGGNIRTAFIYRLDRVSLVSGSERTIGADGQSLNAVDTSQQTDPNNPFYASRPPLAADFTFNGQTVTVVNNHFASKLGSAVLEGGQQPPASAGEVQRAAQAQAVNSFVDGLLAANPSAKVLVTGDLNEFDFEEPINVLKGTASISNYNGSGDGSAQYNTGGAQVLNDLQDTLPADQRFDYVFEGNAQTLDHMLVTGGLLNNAQFEPVHINSEFSDQTSDHDPLIARLEVGAPVFTTQVVVSGQASYALAAGAELKVAAGPAVKWDLAPATTGANATIDNFGKISVVNGNAIATSGAANAGSPNHLTVVNQEGASISTPGGSGGGDAIHIDVDLPNGVILIDNAGLIEATGTGSSNGQAIDFNKIKAATVSSTIINRATGVVRAAEADAIRPGAHVQIDNYGKIQGLGGNDAVDFQDTGYGSIHNFATGEITGTRHGITGKLAVSVTNEAGGQITGQLGSGINLDTASNVASTVVNKGTISGTAAGTSDGDGVDVDGLLTLDNYGLIQGLGSSTASLSEGLAIGGGAVNNYAGGKIFGADRAITVDDSNLGSAFAATTIVNEGVIEGGKGSAILISGTFADSLTNKGTITGSVALGGGDDKLVAYTGSTFSAGVDGGAGADTVELRGTGTGTLGGLTGFETVKLYEGAWTLGSEAFGKLDLQTGAQSVHLAAPTLSDGKFDASIAGFGTDDAIYLDGASATKATLGAGNLVTVNLAGGGTIQLQLDAAADYSGQVVKAVDDGQGGAKLTLALNTAPTAVNDAAAVLERGTVNIDVLANDTDPDQGDAKSIVSVSATAKGSTVAIVDGHIAYTADADSLALLKAGQTAVDTFTYVMQDAAGATSTATVSVTVTGVPNGAPVNGGNGNEVLNGTAADEAVSGGNGNDTLHGLGGADTLSGGNGDDKLYGDAGPDSLDGGNGNDLMDGGDGPDSFDGGNGDDTMIGGAGNDVFSGGNGDDRMDGGLGNDSFTGGNGSDTYVYAGAFGKDVVTDFRAGEDNLQFAKSLFANYAAVLAHAAQVGGSVVITYDADDTITLQGVTLSSLHTGDFVFV